MSDTGKSFFTRRTLFITLALIVAFSGLLRWEGLPAWCKYGLGVWSGVQTNCTSQHLLDPYSLSHVLHGVIFFWLLRPFAAKLALHWRFIAALTFEIGWEVLENSPWVIERYRNDTAAFDYRGDSILNSLGDVVATLIGFAFASRYSWKASIALFIGFELLLLYIARDNLTLNVLMILFPIEAIKQWQLAN
jgi:Protein of unknown function (DUF2585)